jgi:hypothetical protein
LGEAAKEVSAIVERFTGTPISNEQASEIASRFAHSLRQEETTAATASNGLSASSADTPLKT